MRRTITISLLFSLLAIVSQTMRGGILPSKDGAEASLTDANGKTTYYSLLTEAWEAAQGKTATVTVLSTNVNLGEKRLEITDKNSNIKLCKDSNTTDMVIVYSKNNQSVIDVCTGSLTIESEISVDFRIGNEGEAGAVIYMSGDGKLVLNKVWLYSDHSYGIIQRSSEPVVINDADIAGGTRSGVVYQSIISNSEKCRFVIEGGTFKTGVYNLTGGIKEWLGEGKAYYTSYNPYKDKLYFGNENQTNECLNVFDCLHNYMKGEWTYSEGVAEGKCAVCGDVCKINSPAAKIEYTPEDGKISEVFYTAELDKDIQDYIYRNKSVTMTLLRDAAIATSDKVFYISGNVTIEGKEYTLVGNVSVENAVIKSGKFKSDSDDAIYSYKNLHIEGGEFYSKKRPVYSGGQLTIDGGVFVCEGESNSVYAKLWCEINGGTFISKMPGNPALQISAGKLNGGYFPVTVTSDGKHCGGIKCDTWHAAPLDFLGEGKAFFVNKECTQYLVNDIQNQRNGDLFADCSVYVGNCYSHLYFGNNAPTGEVECSYCKAKIAAENFVAKSKVTMSQNDTEINSCTCYLTDVDQCLSYYVPETYITTQTDVTLISDAASDAAHLLAGKAKVSINGGDYKLTNATAGKSYFMQVEEGSSLSIEGGIFESKGNHDMIYVKDGGALQISGGKFLTKDGCYSVKAEATADVKLIKGEFQHGIFSIEQTLNNWLTGDAYYYIYEGDGVSTALKQKTDGAGLTNIGDYTVISLCPGHQWSEWAISEKKKDGASIEIVEKQTCSVCGLDQTRKRYEVTCDHRNGVDWTGNTSGLCPLCDEPISLDINADNADEKILIDTDGAHVYKSLTFTRNYKTPNIFYSFCVPFSTMVGDWKDGGEAVYTFYEIYNIVQYDNDDDGELDEMRIVVNVLHDDDEVKANTPYFVKLKKGGVQTTTFTAVPVSATSEPIEPMWCASTKSYYKFYCSYASVSNLNDGKTYNVNDGKYNRITKAATKITPTRWYMQIDDRETAEFVREAKAISIYVLGEDDDMTDIKEMNKIPDNSKIYNTNGMRLSVPARGQINIINGKKTFVR